jgi:thiol-disulfide isomerase/thioredoxin
MLPLGTPIRTFHLPDVVSGRVVSPADFADRKALLIMFICEHCPYVKHVRSELARLGKDYADRSLGIIAISSNDVETYPDDSPANLKRMAQQAGFSFPVCYDETQDVAKAFTAACTPDFFLFDENRKLEYRGQLDDSRPDQGTSNGRDLRAAIDAVLENRQVDPDQKPSIGCNIKWKRGNQPS